MAGGGLKCYAKVKVVIGLLQCVKLLQPSFDCVNKIHAPPPTSRVCAIDMIELTHIFDVE